MCLINLITYFKDVQQKINLDIKQEIELKPDKTLEDLEILNKILEYQQIGLESYNNIIPNSFYIKQRKDRDNIPNSKNIKQFVVGDIFEFVFWISSLALKFNGICIALRKKAFILPDVSFLVRNIIVNAHIEVVGSYFYNRLYNLKFLDYKRKFYTFNRNKLYYIRDRLNRESRVL